MTGGLLGGLGKAAGGLLGGASSIFGGAKYWLIAIVASNLIVGSVAYYKGSDRVITKVVNASTAQLASASTLAAQAQAKKDATDLKNTKLDYEDRLLKQKAADQALLAIWKNRATLVPHNAICLVRGAAMDTLNDPKLVGEVQ